MNKIRQYLSIIIRPLTLIITIGMLGSCKDDPVSPIAGFSFESDGRQVTFTSTSTNANTFLWDFGDGETSTEENPVYTYDSYGKYTVKLTATGSGGSAISSPKEILLAKTSPVVINESVEEWDVIEDAVTSSTSSSGTITKVKVDYDATKIYFYVEGTGNLGGFFDIHINSDNNVTTGFSNHWYPKGHGSDHLVQGNFADLSNSWVGVFKDKAGPADEWSWELIIDSSSEIIESSKLIDQGSGKAIEFSILRSSFASLSPDGFSFAVVDIDGTVDPDNTTATWEWLGYLPVHNTEDSKLKFIDLTK